MSGPPGDSVAQASADEVEHFDDPPTGVVGWSATDVRVMAWRLAPVATIDVDRDDDLLTVTFFEGLPDDEIDLGPDLSVGFVAAGEVHLVTTICLDGLAGRSSASESVATLQRLLGPTVGDLIGDTADGRREVPLAVDEAADLTRTWTNFVTHSNADRRPECTVPVAMDIELAVDSGGSLRGQRPVALRDVFGTVLESLPRSVTGRLKCWLDDDGLNVRLSGSLNNLGSLATTITLGARLVGDGPNFHWAGSLTFPGPGQRLLAMTTQLPARKLTHQGDRTWAQVQFLARRVLASRSWNVTQWPQRFPIFDDELFQAIYGRVRRKDEPAPAVSLRQEPPVGWAITAKLPSRLPPGRGVVARMGSADRQTMLPLEPVGDRDGAVWLVGREETDARRRSTPEVLTLEVVDSLAGSSA